jgi:hypothetical protein
MEATAPFTHADIDRRIRRLVEACIVKIDQDPSLIQLVRLQVARWTNPRLRAEWDGFLSLSWPELRAKLLQDAEEGNRIRQSAPLGGLLTNQERMDLLRSE